MTILSSTIFRSIGVLWLVSGAGTTGNTADLTFHGPGYQPDARAIAIAPNGDIWVGSGSNIESFTPQGVFQRVERTPGFQPNSMVFDAGGNLIVGFNHIGISLYRPDGEQKISDREFTGYAPWEIAVDSKGNLWATDTGGGRLKKFAIGGTLPVLMQTVTAPADAPLEHPYSVALDAADRLYVSDQDKPGLWLFNADGSFARRSLPDQKCWRIRRGSEGMYVVVEDGVTILDPQTGAVRRHLDTLGGYGAAMGFAVAPDGALYFGDFHTGIVSHTGPDGKVTAILGASYAATVAVPEAWTPRQTVKLPLKLQPVATKPLGQVPPQWSVELEPVTLGVGDPDLNYASREGSVPDPNWHAGTGQKLPTRVEPDRLTITLPAVAAPNFYRLKITADAQVPDSLRAQTPGGLDAQAPGGLETRRQVIRVVDPDAAGGSLTLYTPRTRTVFQHGETIEINVILRDRKTVPAGTLQFSLARRAGDAVAFTPDATPWKSFAIRDSGVQPVNTLTFHATAAALQPGRYLLQAEFRAPGRIWRDVMPWQIVSEIEATRFRILFPEWSAGYTDIWGPFTGKGIQTESAFMAHEGINLYDMTIGGRAAAADVQPSGEAAQLAPALMEQAAQEPSLPAPEKYLPPSGLEIEMQEALRNGMTVQQDFWGTHFLNNWGMAHPLGVPRDNRIARMWTQWQREWPSWIGHRYLTLSLDEGDNSERGALVEQAKAKGLIPPTEEELKWARNGSSWSDLRRYITDAPAPVDSVLSAVGSDPQGNVIIGSRAGILLRYRPDGTLISKVTIPGDIMDLAVAADGTVYGAHLGTTVSVTTADGKTTQWSPVGFTHYSPRGLALAPDGTLLLSDEAGARVARFTTAGKYLGDFADQKNLSAPGGIALLKDGTVIIADGGRGGLSFFRPDGTPFKFIPKSAIVSAGGKVDVAVAPDGTIWSTMGWGALNHYDRDGNPLLGLGRPTFAPGGVSLPMSIAFNPAGHILVSDVALPYVQELTMRNEPVHLFGLCTLLADVRVDRRRLVWGERLIASVWIPVQGQEGDPKSTLQAFAKPAADPDTAWQRVALQAGSGGDFALTTPHLNGPIVLRLIWAPLGAKVDEPRHTDFQLEVSERRSPADQARYEDILQREVKWKDLWARTRMGTLVRWTKLSDAIAQSGGHAPTQDTAPTNYGTPDTLAEGVWIPYRREALVAEAENEGHDYGSFPVMGPFYVARALEGPDPKPAWSSLLQRYWQYREGHVTPSPRIFRDVVTLLGTGASGMGTGTVVSKMTPPELALHRKIVALLHRLGDATMQLGLPGEGGVAILHSFTQEAMDPWMEEQFYAVHAVWYDLLRAHIPNAVVSEATIAQGGLKGRFKAVMLPDIQHPLPAATLQGLRDFEAAGGEVWVDLGTRIQVPGAHLLMTRYRPFWVQDAYYWMHMGYGVGGYDGNWEYWRMRQGSNLRLPALKAAFGHLNTMPVTTGDADVFLQQCRGGEAHYIFAGSDHYPDKAIYLTWLAADEPVPARSDFAIKVPAGGAVYDAIAMQRIPGGALPVEFTNDQPARIWAVLPRPIARIAVQASLPATPGDRLFITATVQDAAGRPIQAVVPLEATVTAPDGTVAQHWWRSTGWAGVCRLQMPAGWMMQPGIWRVEVRELLSGLRATPVTVAVAARPPADLTREAVATLVFDQATIAKWLTAMQGKEVWIGLDQKQAVLRPEADSLARELSRLGVPARVVDIQSLPEVPVFMSYGQSKEQAATLDKVRAGAAVGSYVADGAAFASPGSSLVIMRPLILLGDPTQNRWFEEINYWHLERRTLSPNYPGPGRALLQYCWAPFYDGYDAVTISAADPAGVRAGIQTLLGLATKR